MSIKAIPIYPPTLCLQPEAKLMEALKLMLEKQINHVPLCDGSGGFAGVVSTNAVLRALIPASARAEGGLSDLRFAGDAERMLTSRLHDLERLTVGEFARKDIPLLDEDCPLLEAALLLTNSTAPLPVVGADGKLRGMLSRRALLAYLAQQAGL
ncbi:CBS domain-containing protein [Sulfuricella sp.]|uniref:CBS domain-containing protein n=1 Tax=Sulfuricella sp. TaxID=2099377 RepID=UPI002C439C50|nr:CBS domain-containing protein [Sulfuricella sp.]HUX64978.1 CBS domain-containing protein [Sulfuricella sp.]